MIGLDTNVIVRFLTHDDPQQTAAARRLMHSLSPDAPGFVSLIVVAELGWVLQTSYGFTRKEIEQVMENLLDSSALVVEQTDLVWQALRIFKAGRACFADCLIESCGRAAECDNTVTFDKNAAAGAGMRLLR
jgi:predicted nucleic-acid-binding protein